MRQSFVMIPGRSFVFQAPLALLLAVSAVEFAVQVAWSSPVSVRGITIDRFGKETEIATKGRHDPCVGIRAVPVGEAMMAIVLADALLEKFGADSLTELRRNVDGYLEQVARY